MSKNWLNIYLDKEERKKIDNLKVKYQLSLTTIVDILCEITWDCLLLNADKQIISKVTTTNIYPLKGKTSIKMPRSMSRYSLEHPSKYANNCLHFYLNKEIHLFIKNADILSAKHGYWNRVEEQLVKRTDNWWSYNTNLRMQRRMLRENKEYFKKALENER